MKPTIKFSRDIEEKKVIESKIGTYHSYSQVAMSLLNVDKEHTNLSIEMQFPDLETLENVSGHIREVWKKSESIKCLMRCVVKNDKPLAEFEDQSYELDFSVPATAEEYRGNAFIIDFFIDDTEHRYKLYNWNGISLSKLLKLVIAE